MRVTLRCGGNDFGSAEWDDLPIEGEVISLRAADGLATEARRVEKIEDDTSGGKVVHLGGTQPIFAFRR